MLQKFQNYKNDFVKKMILIEVVFYDTCKPKKR
jgi:hypothetical protein